LIVPGGVGATVRDAERGPVGPGGIAETNYADGRASGPEPRGASSGPENYHYLGRLGFISVTAYQPYQTRFEGRLDAQA
jgi:hypothetical protein